MELFPRNLTDRFDLPRIWACQSGTLAHAAQKPSSAAFTRLARIWAARGADDWVGNVPHLSVGLLGTTVGFGTDPVSPAFGARVFAAGDGGHSDYFDPGSTSLANLTRIVLGETRAVTS